MRLRLRSRAGGSSERPKRWEDRTRERRSPPSTVTAWLRQGLRSGICPLCRVAHKADREYVWQFYDERSNDGAVLDEVSRAFGFCAQHIEMLRRIDVEDMKSNLAISTMFADTLAGMETQLGELGADDEFTPARCPACASRDLNLDKNALYLLDLLGTAPGYRESFEASPGLCFPHFKLAWDLAPLRVDRELLLAVQHRATSSLLQELREHVRKQDHKFSHEPKGPEQDSWQRAIFLTAGWPAPERSAGQPEQRD